MVHQYILHTEDPQSRNSMDNQEYTVESSSNSEMSKSVDNNHLVSF